MTPASLLRLADDVLELDGKATPFESLTVNRYAHGGGRVFLDGESGQRALVADFFDEDNREAWIASRTSAVSLARAVRALVPLLKHGDECSIHGPGVRPCDCGLDSALASLGKDAHGR